MLQEQVDRELYPLLPRSQVIRSVGRHRARLQSARTIGPMASQQNPSLLRLRRGTEVFYNFAWNRLLIHCSVRLTLITLNLFYHITARHNIFFCVIYSYSGN
jgi:hypothetical protein